MFWPKNAATKHDFSGFIGQNSQILAKKSVLAESPKKEITETTETERKLFRFDHYRHLRLRRLCLRRHRGAPLVDLLVRRDVR